MGSGFSKTTGQCYLCVDLTDLLRDTDNSKKVNIADEVL